MNVDRLSVTLESELGVAVRAAASRAGLSVSAWIAAAASERLRHDLLGQALDAWEAETRPLDEGELDVAATALGIVRRPR